MNTSTLYIAGEDIYPAYKGIMFTVTEYNHGYKVEDITHESRELFDMFNNEVAFDRAQVYANNLYRRHNKKESNVISFPDKNSHKRAYLSLVTRIK